MSRPPDQSVRLDSSVLASMTSAAEATLDLRFRSGTLYRYFSVPPHVLNGLIAAPSKGAYFNRHIRHRFRYQRLA